MMKQRMLGTAASIVAILMMVSCAESPLTPERSQLPFLAIDGPASIPPSVTARFAAIAHDSSGKTIDVTSQATWESSTPGVLEVSPGGLVQARALGEATLTARFQGLSLARLVMVLPDGTMRFRGRVAQFDSEFAQSIGGAAVEVVSGTGLGLRTTTDAATGVFALYGVSGQIQIRVTADGYLPKTSGMIRVVDFSQQVLVLTLAPVGGTTEELSGTWTLKLTPASCPFLPASARLRQFNSEITQSGSLMTMRLWAPSVSTAELTPQFAGGILSVLLPSYPGDVLDGPEYAVVDLLPPPARLGLRGVIRLPFDTERPNVLQGVFDGAFDYYTDTIRLGAAAMCVGQGQAVMERGQSR